MAIPGVEQKFVFIRAEPFAEHPVGQRRQGPLKLAELLHIIVNLVVGHSYTGAVITEVAGQVPERLNMLVYLDAVIFENGQSGLSVQPKASSAWNHGVVAYRLRRHDSHAE